MSLQKILAIKKIILEKKPHTDRNFMPSSVSPYLSRHYAPKLIGVYLLSSLCDDNPILFFLDYTVESYMLNFTKRKNKNEIVEGLYELGT